MILPAMAGMAQSKRVPGLVIYAHLVTPEEQKANPKDTLYDAYRIIGLPANWNTKEEIIDTIYLSRKWANGFLLVGDTVGVTPMRKEHK